MDVNLKARLSASGIIEKLKSSGDKYANISDSKSLIAIHEQQLYVWHGEESNVLTANFNGTAEQLSDDCKMLIPSNAPIFDVECLLINGLGTLLAATGRKGIMVMEVPWDVCKLRVYAAGNNCLFCRSWPIAHKMFTYTSRVMLLQAAWYPGVKNNTYLMTLSTDNYIRLYDVMDLPTPLQVISLGMNSNTSFISTEFAISLPSCLGESAVSFDFGPPEDIKPKSFSVNEVSTMESAEVVYPVYVLHGNGDVYVVRMSMKKNGARSAKVLGPLSMYPSAEDNYGVDACTLLCLHTNPPVLVLAMASGILYHCLVLNDYVDVQESKQDISWLSADSETCPALYVHGSVQLPMVITTEDDVYSQAIRLYRDAISTCKYHCSMVCGVHTVVVPFIKKMEDCGGKDDVDGVISELQENDCIVEHLLCTQALPSVSPVPVVGLATAIRNTNVTLICLLASWEFECLSLLSSYRSYAPSLLSSEAKLSAQDEEQSERTENFESHIQRLLHRSTGTPLLKSSVNSEGKEPSPKQLLELVCSVTHRLKEEYIQKFYTVQDQIDTRAKILTRHKQKQIHEIERLMEEKDALRSKTQQLAEKYEDAHSKQQQLFERIETVLKVLEQRFPCLSNAEINMKKDLEGIAEKLKAYTTSTDQLKKKLKLHEQKVEEYKKSKSTDKLTKHVSKMQIGEVQLKHIMEVLREEGKSISKLARNVSDLRKEIVSFS